MSDVFSRYWYLRVMLSFWVIVSVGCHAATNSCMDSSIMDDNAIHNILTSGGFSGLLDESARLKYFGCYKDFSIYVYKREFGNARVSQRLIILSNKKYLGMYEITEVPSSIDGAKIVFPFPIEHGNFISLENGAPSTVLLDGEEMEFFK